MDRMARQPLSWSAPFTTLGEDIFYAKVSPSALSNPRWIDVNENLLEEMGLPLDVENPKTLEAFAGGIPLDGWNPIAQVYSGHQFGQWAANWVMGEGYIWVNALGLNGISRVPEKHHIRDLATGDPFSEVQSESTWALNTCTHLGYRQRAR